MTCDMKGFYLHIRWSPRQHTTARTCRSAAPLWCPGDGDAAPTASAAAPPPHRSRRTHHWKYVDFPGTWDWEQQRFSHCRWRVHFIFIRKHLGTKSLTQILKVKPLRGRKNGHSSQKCNHDNNYQVLYWSVQLLRFLKLIPRTFTITSSLIGHDFRIRARHTKLPQRPMVIFIIQLFM